MSALVLMFLVVPAGAATPHRLVTAPFHGGVLPSSTLTTYSCHSKAVQPVAWHFNFGTGFGGGSDAASARTCDQTAYRLGAQSSASVSAGVEVSIGIRVPAGSTNVSANVTLRDLAAIRVASGAVSGPNGTCPTTPFSSTSASYYNGSAWSYWPSLSSPVSFTNKTYFYYYYDHGRSGGCTAFASVDAGVAGYMVASNGLAGYSLTPSVVQFGGYDWITNSTYWSCSNYTLWSYGGWYNSTGSCSSSNQTQIQYCIYSCSWPTVTSFVPVASMKWANTTNFTMYANQNFSASRTWDLFLDLFCSLQVYSFGWPYGSASATLNMATLGNGVTLHSISVT